MPTTTPKPSDVAGQDGGRPDSGPDFGTLSPRSRRPDQELARGNSRRPTAERGRTHVDGGVHPSAPALSRLPHGSTVRLSGRGRGRDRGRGRGRGVGSSRAHSAHWTVGTGLGASALALAALLLACGGADPPSGLAA